MKHITTSPGASIGHDDETLPAKAHFPYTSDERDDCLVITIQRLAKAVSDQCDLRCMFSSTYTQRFGPNWTIQICLAADASEARDDDWLHLHARDTESLTRMRDQLTDFIATHRTPEQPS